MSKFDSDLRQENILAEYLDQVYKSKHLNYRRIANKELQHRGVDLILKHNNKSYNIDEKAQLHYFNKDLPTFTFELSYLNASGKRKKGWLFDESKTTDYYFLITGIKLKSDLNTLNSSNDISSLKILSVNRRSLIQNLEKLGLGYNQLEAYDLRLRESRTFGKTTVKELKPRKEGLLFYSEHLAEKPMNLQLRLNWLDDCGIGKRL